MCKEINVWDKAILWGHQWVVYQLVTSCESLAKVLVILSIIVICARGFSKQNAIKSHLRVSLKLATLDALIWVSLCGIRGGEYGMEGSIWVMAQYEESMSS